VGVFYRMILATGIGLLIACIIATALVVYRESVM
jgi:hypothetical protein